MPTTSETLLTTPCSCGGSNENCFKCGGWGYIDRIGIGRSTPIAHGVGPKVTAKPRKVGKRRRISGTPISTSSESNEEKQNRIGKLLAKTLRAIDKIENEHGTKSIRALAVCSLCKAQVRADRLVKHQLSVHEKKIETRTVASSIPRNAVKAREAHGKAGPGDSQQSQERQGAERRMDATRDYYAAYRDNGQFGSHPFHDGYDDESEP